MGTMTEGRFKKEILPLSVRVYPLALRLLGNHEAARDAVQQGMLKLWEKRNLLDQYNNIVAFVFTVVRNVCLDEIKKKRPVAIDDFTQLIGLTGDAERNYDNIEAVNLVKAIIDKLPKIQGDVITLRDIDGLEFEEIAQVLNIEITYVRVLLSRARKQVREQLEKKYSYGTIRKR